VFPASSASTLAGGKKGSWWKTWGPIFETYTYEDMSSRTTIYMRRNLLRLGQSHRIARCDGKPPYITFTEGSNYFGNVIRSWFGYNQAKTFKIYLDDKEVWVAEESAGDVPSVTFRDMNNQEKASAVLQTRDFHKNKDQWLITVDVRKNETQQVPYFVQNAAALLFAVQEQEKDAAKQPEQPPPSLAAIPGPSGVRGKQQQQQQQQKQEGKQVLEQNIIASSALAVNDEILPNSTAVASSSRATSNAQQQVQQMRQSTAKAPVMVEHI